MVRRCSPGIKDSRLFSSAASQKQRRHALVLKPVRVEAELLLAAHLAGRRVRRLQTVRPNPFCSVCPVYRIEERLSSISSENHLKCVLWISGSAD
jgi:hypothetical protein